MNERYEQQLSFDELPVLVRQRFGEMLNEAGILLDDDVPRFYARQTRGRIGQLVAPFFDHSTYVLAYGHDKVKHRRTGHAIPDEGSYSVQEFDERYGYNYFVSLDGQNRIKLEGEPVSQENAPEPLQKIINHYLKREGMPTDVFITLLALNKITTPEGEVFYKLSFHERRHGGTNDVVEMDVFLDQKGGKIEKIIPIRDTGATCMHAMTLDEFKDL